MPSARYRGPPMMLANMRAQGVLTRIPHLRHGLRHVGPLGIRCPTPLGATHRYGIAVGDGLQMRRCETENLLSQMNRLPWRFAMARLPPPWRCGRRRGVGAPLEPQGHPHRDQEEPQDEHRSPAP